MSGRFASFVAFRPPRRGRAATRAGRASVRIMLAVLTVLILLVGQSVRAVTAAQVMPRYLGVLCATSGDRAGSGAESDAPETDGVVHAHCLSCASTVHPAVLHAAVAGSVPVLADGALSRGASVVRPPTGRAWPGGRPRAPPPLS